MTMVKTISLLAALGLLAAVSAARADDARRTVSDYAVAMEATAARLDEQVTARQRAGDMAAAQRLVLAAAMVRRTAEEFREAEQEAMTEPVGALPAPVRARADAAFTRAAEAETRAADSSDFVAEAHTTFNALLAVLSQHPPHPVFFGLLSADLTGQGAPLGSDVVIYGYRLFDPLSKAAPVVLYGKAELEGVKISDDRIEVTLPESVKRALHFAPPPCEQRPSFGLRVRETYWMPHGFWPLRWNSEVLTNTDLFALPTPTVYSATISASAQTAAAQSETRSFRQKSGLAVAECSQSKTAELRVALPDEARGATCSAAWVDASGAARTTAHCAIEGHVAHAVGEIAGVAKVCSPDGLCTCLTQAQGWLEASGGYRVDEAAAPLQVAAAPPPIDFPAGGLAHGRLALGDGQTLRHIALTISRRACPTPIDALDLNPGEDPDAEASGVSRSGAVRAVLKGGELTVGAADALTASAARAP